MGSYVISVSLGKGCYRHIQISASATLYKLHQAILYAFEFQDDHLHAFFMDNRCWSRVGAYYSTDEMADGRDTKKYKLKDLRLSEGDRFKYIFDFGDEWRFQCKVLRKLEESTKTPIVIRSVGEAPEQYPVFDQEELWDDGEEAPLTREQIDEIYERIPLSRQQIDLIHKYMDAASRLYGLVSLAKVWEIYNGQNPAVTAKDFLMAAAALGCEENDYGVVDRGGLSMEIPEQMIEAVEILADYLFIEDPEWNRLLLRRQQKGKPYKVLPKEEFLRYADPVYYPDTAARRAMIEYLRRRAASIFLEPEVFCTALQDIIVIDIPVREMVDMVEEEGLVFNKKWSIEEFLRLYQDLNNNTHKHANRGYTPNELFALSPRGKALEERLAPPGQMSLFDGQEIKPALKLVKTPARNGPCPCGSGRKYKNCCGKGS